MTGKKNKKQSKNHIEELNNGKPTKEKRDVKRSTIESNGQRGAKKITRNNEGT